MNISVIKTVTQSLCDVWRHKLEWVRILSGPAVFWVFGALLLRTIDWGISFSLINQDTDYSSIFQSLFSSKNSLLYFFALVLIQLLFLLIVFANIYISTARYALYREYGDRWFIFQWNKRLVRMMVYFVFVNIFLLFLGVIAGIMMLVSFLTLLQDTFPRWVALFLWAVPMLGFFYVGMRLSLYSLLIAADYKSPLKTSWRLLKNHVLKLLAIVVFLWIGIGLLALVVTGVIMGLSYILEEGFIFDTLKTVANMSVWFIGIAFYMQAYAYVYKAITDTKQS